MVIVVVSAVLVNGGLWPPLRFRLCDPELLLEVLHAYLLGDESDSDEPE